ncbi:single-stranded DNA-binding protein [uncultured Photobacterium sp.]|uniref:single-stranded DNA-binding protein n=1 Tax=uncultured Photobacterium sp. TaxID=173973 RepID=UPI0026164AFB|nr:single-stranded DNA-binding protein [uncultured Photobacterium sp.]
MKAFRSNTGFVAGTVTQSNKANGQTTFWVDQVTSWNDSQGAPKSRTAQIQCTVANELDLQPGNQLLMKVCVQTFEAQGNNGSKVTSTYYKVLDFFGFAPTPDNALNLNQFTLGGNVGMVEHKSGNNGSWYNVSVALTRSYQVNNNWQDETHWVRVVISDKLFNQNFKNGLNKGDSLIVDAELTTNAYTDKHGNQVLGNEFRVNRVLGQVTKAELNLLKTQQPSQHMPQGNAPQQNFAPQGQPQGNAPQQNFAPQGQPQGNAPQQNFVPQGQPQGNAPQQNYAPQNNASQQPQNNTPQGNVPQQPQQHFAPQGGQQGFVPQS